MRKLKKIVVAFSRISGFFSFAYAIPPVLEKTDSTEFFELDDIDAHKDFVYTKSLAADTVDIYSNPACALYNYSWTSERLSPYRIKKDS